MGAVTWLHEALDMMRPCHVLRRNDVEVHVHGNRRPSVHLVSPNGAWRRVPRERCAEVLRCGSFLEAMAALRRPG